MATETTSSQNKNFVSPLLVLLLIGAAFGIGYMWQRIQTLESGSKTKEVAGVAQPDAGVEQPTGEVAPVTDADHVRGDNNAQITWIEYSDLQCPYCAQIQPDLVKLLGEYDGKVRWVYRHFPLDQIHPFARPLAQGSECAATLGGDDKFWEFVDYTFENKSTDPKAVATAIGLNAGQFDTCLNSEEVKTRVENDYNTGLTAGVRGTPGNFVIGPDGETKTIPGALPYAQLKATVDAML
ncbi:MAG: Sodium/proton antiporter [Candidatus Roizmanbacteria bacterium GW2011_GWB1_40_7]|uniref:Sodium/proton antiporter n=2 Tax=Candidatus Roizmaniibacteriota TaxID=1752723 RepID=A0A0G0T2W3_9BACT|nr:MAG: Sodium/proton antiporter [Candidatus Roizmanbacteria bacterium GW2011_GWB1_40_7]